MLPSPAISTTNGDIANVFDPNLIVFAKADGPNLSLKSTLQLTQTLRAALMSECPEPVPNWLSGHAGEGGRRGESPHLAFVPLPFVGGEHADGHLMGCAIAAPQRAFARGITAAELHRCLGPVLSDGGGDDRVVGLFPPKSGKSQPWAWTIQHERRPNPPQRALRSQTWTRPSSVWASVTPVVLPRYPKRNPKTQRAEWEREVAQIVAIACEQSALPRPERIEVSGTSWLAGVPDSRLFSPLPTRKNGSSDSCRLQTHAALVFEEEVRGPVLIGSGRYAGYGFFKPLEEE